MLSMQERETLEQQITPLIRTMQIIVASLAMGPVFFAVFLLVMMQVEVDGDAAMMTIVMAVLAVIVIALRLFIPSVVCRAQIQQLARGVPEGDPQAARLEDAKALAGIYQTSTIIACALLEGAAFGNLIAYMLEGRLVSLAIAAAMIVGVLAHLPTTGRVMSWIESRLDEIERQRGTVL